MLAKPRLLINKHKHVRFKWRCFWGRHNGYADTPKKAYEAMCKSLLSGSRRYRESDFKRCPNMKVLYETLTENRM